jgi:hypothetical protein
MQPNALDLEIEFLYLQSVGVNVRVRQILTMCGW